MKESERWMWGIGLLLAIALVLFILVVALNAGAILVGTVLTIFQVAVSVLTVVLCLGISLWVLSAILDAVRNSEARLKEGLESLRKSLLRATNKFGSDFLALITGLIVYLVQEAVAGYPRLYKIAICVLFTLTFFLSSQLIGSQKRSDRVLGIFFFLTPPALFAVTLLALIPPEQLLSWVRARPVQERTLMFLVSLSTLLTFVFSCFKHRDV